MIDLFDIKKQKESMVHDNNNVLDAYRETLKSSQEDVLKQYHSSMEGLSAAEVHIRRKRDGLNKVIRDQHHSWLYFFLIAFRDQFIIILFLLAIINGFLGDMLGAAIIVGIGFVSAFIRFIQDYSVYLFNEKLKAQLYTSTTLMRHGKVVTKKVENVVIGDIVKLNAGSIIPGDVMLLEAKDLYVNQSVFTGESQPVAKSTAFHDSKEIFSVDNLCLMGSSVISGLATGIVINTGFDTYLGIMGKEVDNKKVVTNFEKGMAKITQLLIRYMIVVCIVVMVINGLIRGNFSEAVLFALSVAVGITPSMLPMIVNVNLTKGSKSLAKKKTLVKRIESIQNLGAIDVLCTDKTGTLTANKITLQKYIDINGESNLDLLEYAYLNSYYATGLKNLVDKAILSFGEKHHIGDSLKTYKKVDEIPFDYTRKKMTIVISDDDQHYRIITKGALEEVLKGCTKVIDGEDVKPLTQEMIERINEEAKSLAMGGMQVIALAESNDYPGQEHFSSANETEMMFAGFVAFLDPAKKGVKTTLKKLRAIGISPKVLTGDNPYAVTNIAEIVGLRTEHVLLGKDIDDISDEKLKDMIEDVDVYARMNPIQKERIVRLFKEKGHVVGYMGDGVNDAPSLHMSDVGISVDTATDIAKEASDIILLEKSLKVIYDGVLEGRKVYGNIIKYMKMALSADFGDVFSIMIASIFLPFLPLLPIQMLLQDFIYDFSQIAIPYDNVDEEFLASPHRWNTNGIGRFMNIMGPVSSIVDVVSFLIFWFVLGYNSVAMQSSFQTAWFVMCLSTELLIIHNIRTAKRPFIESCASKPLLILTMFSFVLTIITPMLLCKIPTFHFVILPVRYYYFLALMMLFYSVLVTIVKKIYIKKFGEWL